MTMAAPPSKVTTTIAPGANRQGLVLGLGLGLIALNYMVSNEGGDVLASIGLSRILPGTTYREQGHASIGDTVGQLLMLFLLVLLAGIDEAAGTLALVFVLALWAGWLIANYRFVGQLLPRGQSFPLAPPFPAGGQATPATQPASSSSSSPSTSKGK